MIITTTHDAKKMNPNNVKNNKTKKQKKTKTHTIKMVNVRKSTGKDEDKY